MRQYKSWIAALILGSTLSANAQQKNMENKTLNENIPEMIISLEKEALASTDPMAFVELSDTDVIYFDPSLETKIEGLEQLRTYYKGMQLPPADHFDMIRPVVQVAQNIAVLTFNLDSYLSDKVIKWNCTEVYKRNPDNQWKIIQTHWSYVKPLYKMFLSNGTYNFYAVSDNFSTIPPTFTSGVSEPLFNGIDYLWWSAIQQDVNSSQINIPIVYGHVATQVVVELTGGEGITINQLVSAMITPPVVGATMDLGTGVITPATAFGKADKMGINGLTAQYIMLPIRHSAPMTLTLEISADNENSTRTYTTQIPLPDGELKAGNSYLFKAVINGNSVTLASVNVKDWTDVDETGKPLYPTQN